MVRETYQQNAIDYDIHGAQLSEASSTTIPGLKETTNFRPRYSNSGKTNKPKRTIAKFFSEMSRFGMSYEDQVIDNMRAIPADKSLIPKEMQNVDLIQTTMANWKEKSNKDTDFFSQTLDQKRAALRKLAVQPELEDILDEMTNEAVVYDPDYTYFCEPYIEIQELQDLKAKVRKELKNDMSRYFRTFYKMLGWKYRAWDDFKRWLIEGDLAWEIVWDSLEKPKKIIGIVPVDAATLTKKFENNKWYWVQFKGVQGRERKLLDSQIIYIAYQETNAISRQSYLERLIRPFNIYRIIEQAQLIWTITNASFKMRFTIPVKGMNRQNGMMTLNMAMNQYKENIKFQADTGELQINGQTNLPFNKEYWLPENDAGSPQIETLGGDGPDLADNDQLKFFKNQLYKISKIPLTRFDAESGDSWFGSDATSAARTEISFGRFVTRLRNIFSQIMIKPLQLQMAVSHPELLEHKDILEAISLQWKTYNAFEELLEIELMQKRVDFITSMKESMVDMTPDGVETKFFSSKFLVEKYLKLSPQDLDLNDKYKQEEIEDFNLAGGESYDDSNESFDDMIANLTEDEKSAIKAHIIKRKKKKNRPQLEEE